MKLFFYMKTGKLLAEKDRIQTLRQIMPGIEIHEYKKGKLETSTLLKMLVGILEYFSSHPYFLFDNLENIPYFVDPDVHFYVTFNHENCAFELYANIDIAMKNYEIIKFDFTFQFHLSQLVIFTKNEDLSLVGINTNETHPPFYYVNQIMFFLLINESFVITKGTKIGQWEILSLQNKTRYAPLNCPREFLEKGGRAHQNISTFDARQHIAAKLERLLSLKNNSLADENLAGLHDKQSKQIFINSLMARAKVLPHNMPCDRNNRVRTPFYSTIDELNSIIQNIIH